MTMPKFTEINSCGLDIGAAAIKLVKLSILKEQVELSGFALQPTPAALAPVLKSMVESCGIERINLSVCGPATMIRYITFPRMEEAELKQALRFEAPKHIPFPVAEMNLDSYILKRDLPDNKMLVMLVAAKSELINQRLKLIAEAGLKVNIIDLDSVALINAFNFNYPPQGEELIKTKTLALLNIGAGQTNLNILEGGVPHLSRDINIGVNNFSQNLQDALGLLSGEIRTSFDYYESQSASSVLKIFLSGGGSKFQGLKDMLVNLIGIETEYWDPLRRITVSEDADLDLEKIKAASSQLGVAVGLALKP